MLRTRVLTAIVLLGGLLSAVFLLPPLGWLILVSLVCGAAAWEWGGLSRLSAPQRGMLALLAGLACLLVGMVSGLAEAAPKGANALGGFYALSGAFWIGVVPIWLKRKWALSGAASAAGVGLIVLLPTALAMAHLRAEDPWLLLLAIAAVSVADIAAYFSGRAFGRRKLAPQISPGKTWEGAIGAACGVTVLGLVVALSLGSGWAVLPALALLPLLIAYTALSIEGDLFESLLKRQAGLKDSGSILPGHGGILDRIDSLTSTLPLAALAVLLFAK